MTLPASVHRWRVKLWLAALNVAERRLRGAYDQLVDAEQQDRAEGSS